MFCHVLYSTFYVSVSLDGKLQTYCFRLLKHEYFNMYNSFIFRSTTVTAHKIGLSNPIHFLQRVFKNKYKKKNISSLKESQQYKL